MTSLRNIRYRALWPVRRATVQWRRPADVVICGAQKSGTTYLSEVLAAQPGFYLPPVKEIHFFSGFFDKGANWYLSHFETQRSSRTQIDASPSYMIIPGVPERIRATNPDAKLIFLLRDPVERAFSHYQHNRRAGHESLDFEAALKAENERTAADVDALARNPGHVGTSLGLYSYRARGHYASLLKPFYRAFAADQILVLDSAKVFAHEPAEFARLESFLGRSVNLQVEGDLATNAGSYQADAAQNHADLREYFAEMDPELVELTGRTFSWMRS